MRIRTTVAALLTAGTLAAAPAAVSAPQPSAPVAVAAKACSAGFKHAVISGAHKCLRRGQFCARASDREYHRYGHHCHKRDARGNYHLT
jgi:hypothetical protein